MAAKPVGSVQILAQFWEDLDGNVWQNHGGVNGFEKVYMASQVDEIAALKASISYVDDQVELLEAEISTKANSADVESNYKITYAQLDLATHTLYTDIDQANKIVDVKSIVAESYGAILLDVTFDEDGVLDLSELSPSVGFIAEVSGSSGVLNNFVRKSSIDTEVGKNKFNKDAATDGFYKNGDTGAIVPAALYCYSDYIPVTPSTGYYGKGVSAGAIRFATFYNSNKVVVAGGYNASTPTITTPSDAAYAVISVLISDKETFQLEIGAVQTAYEAYTSRVIKIDNIFIKNADKEVYSKTEIDAIVPIVSTVLYSKNLANPARIVTGLIASVADNGWVGSAGWQTLIVPLEELTDNTISGWDTVRTEIAFYSGAVPAVGANPVNANLIRSGSAGNLGLLKEFGKMTFEADAGTTYIAFTIKNNVETTAVYDELQVEVGANSTSYVPFEATSIVDKINDDEIVAKYLQIGNETILASDLVADGEDTRIRAEIDITGDNPTVVSYSYKSKPVVMTVKPFRAVTSDVSSTFEFGDMTIDSVKYQSATDDGTPYRLPVAVGANHGYNKTRITSNAHGKQNVDVGSVWTDGTNQWILINIVSVNQLDVTSRVGDIAILGFNTLTHVSGATNTSSINSTTKVQGILFPAIQNMVKRVFVDDVEITPESKTYYALNTLTFSERYEIMSKESMIDWIILQVGTTDKIIQFEGISIVSVSNTYVFDRTMGCTEYQDFLALENIPSFLDIMFIQSSYGDFSTPQKYLIPKTLPITYNSIVYDFTSPVDITNFPFLSSNDNLNFTSSLVEPTGIYADRVVKLYDGEVGLAVGFTPLRNALNRRTLAARKALQIRGTKKIYMSTVDSDAITSLTKGQYYSVVSYRQFFIKSEGRTAYYVVNTKDGQYMYVDWDEAIFDKILLDENLTGKSFEVVEKSSTVDLLTDYATDSIIVETTGKGYLILKFS